MADISIGYVVFTPKVVSERTTNQLVKKILSKEFREEIKEAKKLLRRTLYGKWSPKNRPKWRSETHSTKDTYQVMMYTESNVFRWLDAGTGERWVAVTSGAPKTRPRDLVSTGPGVTVRKVRVPRPGIAPRKFLHTYAERFGQVEMEKRFKKHVIPDMVRSRLFMFDGRTEYTVVKL
jgi:hypothetical protein